MKKISFPGRVDFCLESKKKNYLLPATQNEFKTLIVLCIVLLFSINPLKSANGPRQSGQFSPVTIACYYFPNYHPNDIRNKELKGSGWSEGSYLEPDTRNKMAYLEAVKNVFGDSLNKRDVANGAIISSSESATKNLPIKGEVFTIEGRTAFLILPEKTTSDSSISWIWYAPTLHKLPGKEEKWMFDKFLDKGIAIAGVDVGESYGSPEGVAIYSALYEELVEKRGLTKKVCLLARSRGGLMLYNWAVENPESVACIAGIYPVCNLSSYPGLATACGAYGMTEEQLANNLAAYNPIDRLASLVKAQVPVFHIHGDNDEVVPLEENSGEVSKRYTELGGNMTLNIINGQGHNMWEGWFQNQDLVNFVITHAEQEIH